MITEPQILAHMSALADGLRSRLVLLLERQELTVSQICTVLQLPQSTVSRHLKTLGDVGWVASRRNGTSRLYHLAEESLDEEARGLWRLARGQVASTAAAEQDGRRLESVLARERTRSREFFDSGAGQWDKLRDELFGTRFYLHGLVGLLEPDWVFADLGCGTGPVAEAVAPVVGKVIAVDASEPMLAAARGRLQRFDNVEVRRGELEALPLADGVVDAATLMLVLHHLPDPREVIAEVARVLRPGGRLLIVDMLPHDRHEYRQEMGHIWMGFSQKQIERYLGACGFGRSYFRCLDPEPAALGPALFSTTAILGNS